MTDTEISKITKISLSTLNGYKNSNGDKALLYYLLKSMNNLDKIYSNIIQDNQLKLFKYTQLENELFALFSKNLEYVNFDFKQEMKFVREIKDEKGTKTIRNVFDFCAVNGEEKIIIFEVKTTLPYGTKLEKIIEGMYDAVKDKYKSIEICFLTLPPKERKFTSKCKVTIESIGNILGIDDEKIIVF